MKIAAEISMYPLDAAYEAPIIEFIRDLRAQPGIEVVTNAMSTQVSGDFDAVTGALNACMRRHLEAAGTIAWVVKYLSVAPPIDEAPRLE
jgi:uncharacterized protein YqgV (UPF0045/DUF77 family)